MTPLDDDMAGAGQGVESGDRSASATGAGDDAVTTAGTQRATGGGAPATTGVEAIATNPGASGDEPDDGPAAAGEDALFSGHADLDDLAAHLPSVSILDFRQPARLGAEIESRLRGVHERFARRLSAAMSLFLGTEVWIGLSSIDARRLATYRESVAESVNFAEVELRPRGMTVVLEWGAALAFALVESLLGGKGSFEHAPRPLTAIEARIFRRLTDKFSHELTRAVHGATGEHEVRSMLGDLSLVAQGDPTALMVHIGMELGFEGGSAPFSLAYRLHDWIQADDSAPPPDPQVRASMTRALQGADIELRVELGQAGLTVDEIRSMRAGDVIRLEQRVDQEVVVRIDRTARFAGMPGKLGTHRAVRVTRVIEEES